MGGSEISRQHVSKYLVQGPPCLKTKRIVGGGEGQPAGWPAGVLRGGWEVERGCGGICLH